MNDSLLKQRMIQSFGVLCLVCAGTVEPSSS